MTIKKNREILEMNKYYKMKLKYKKSRKIWMRTLMNN